MKHDELFKMLLKNRSILRAFFEQFLPEAARFMEFDRLEYVDKERITFWCGTSSSALHPLRSAGRSRNWRQDSSQRTSH